MKKDFTNMLNPVIEDEFADNKETIKKEETKPIKEKVKITKNEQKLTKSFMISNNLYCEVIKLVAEEKMKNPNSFTSFSSIVVQALEEFVSKNK